MWTLDEELGRAHSCMTTCLSGDADERPLCLSCSASAWPPPNVWSSGRERLQITWTSFGGVCYFCMQRPRRAASVQGFLF